MIQHCLQASFQVLSLSEILLPSIRYPLATCTKSGLVMFNERITLVVEKLLPLAHHTQELVVEDQ